MRAKIQVDDTMLEIVDDISFYVDETNKNEIYVEFKTIGGGGHLYKVDDVKFLSILGNEYRKKTGLLANPDFKPLLDIHCQDAIATGASTVKLNHRLFGSLATNQIYYSFDESKKQCVSITPNKWGFKPYVNAHVR